MKSLSFALALLAVVGIVVQPVAPAFALTADEPVLSTQLHGPHLPHIQRDLVVGETLDEFILNAQMDRVTREKLADHAQLGEAAILSPAQMDDLARTHPQLRTKLMNAYRTTSIPKLTAPEKKLVAQMTAENLSAFKAGGADCTGTDATTFKLADAGPIKLATLAPCLTSPSPSPSGGGTAGAWIVVALMLVLIIGFPLFCALFGNPPICRGWGF